MQPFTVLYRTEELLPADPPLAFLCQADDTEHAEEQCENAYPGCDVVWTVITDDVQEAYADYWGSDYWGEDDGQPDEMQEWADFDPDC